MRKIILGVFLLSTLTVLFFSCQTADKIRQDAYYVNGRDLYISRCQNCHGAKGEGLGALAPPLTDSIYLKKNKQLLACFIKNGINDVPVTVNGQVYEGKMPAFNMADIDIAQLIVYITNDFGNKQGMYTTEQVAQDLKACKP
ncbi:c-type cytochrome [Pedobacter sp. AW31-3R]|uniref:c-type cytochrome n=1 Tax=Pedobacter sp. AW31-3R TaxID=3445781 RepID=UPI003FA0F9EE